MSVLVIADHESGVLKPGTAAVITAAAAIDSDVHVLVAGTDAAAAAAQAAAVQGVAKVRVADAAHYGAMLAEPMAELLRAMSGDYAAILAVANTDGKNFMPRLAALLDVSQISDITEVVSPDTFVRPIYAGNAMATVRSGDGIKIITVRTTTFAKAELEGGSAPIEDVAAAGDPGISSFVKNELSDSERPELTSARVVISGGRGMQSGENFPMLFEIADQLGAAVGASRAAVDAGYVPNEFQVGQTGKVVAPELYIAVGISGAIQHLAGMKDSKVIVAINKDEEAPIFQVADFGLVADLFKAVPELKEALEKLPPA